MPVDIKIVRKKGFKLNPDDVVVNAIFKALERLDGHCPSPVTNRRGHDQCPCSEYLQHNNCYCKLYVKDDDIPLRGSDNKT
mgnify:FL=1